MYETINPFTEELVKSFGSHTNAELESVIAKAQETYENGWILRSPAERKGIVKKAASILREKRDEFAKLVTLEMGKLFREAQAEVDPSADILDYYGDHAKKFLAPQKLKIDTGEAIVENKPLGVIFCVEPWNLPYYADNAQATEFGVQRSTLDSKIKSLNINTHCPNTLVVSFWPKMPNFR